MAARGASGPPSYMGLGHLIAMRRDPLGFLLEAAERYGGLVPLRFGPMAAWLISDPGLAQELLTTGEEQTRKGFGNDRLAPLIGDGVFLSEGEDWRRRRDALRPIFEVKRFAAIEQDLARGIAAGLESWPEDGPFELFPRVQALTLSALSQALFGRDLLREEPELLGRLGRLWGELEHRAASLIPFLDRLPLARNRRFCEERAALDALVYQVIDEGPGGLWGAVAPGALSRREMRNEVVTFLIAGQECTSISVAWALHLLARHPRVSEELAGALPAEASELESCPALRRVYDEALRLYPPAWLIARQANGPFRLGEQAIAADSLLLVAPWVMHRLGRRWESPAEFRPERMAKPAAPGTFLPFGLGPRVCLGRPLALLIARLTLGSALRRFRLEPGSDEPLEPRPGLTLRPRPGLSLRVRAR